MTNDCFAHIYMASVGFYKQRNKMIDETFREAQVFKFFKTSAGVINPTRLVLQED